MRRAVEDTFWSVHHQLICEAQGVKLLIPYENVESLSVPE